MRKIKLFMSKLWPSFILAFNLHGKIAISPTKIDLSPKNSIQEMSLENKGNEDVFFEASLKRWSQKNGQDIYEDTKDILILPVTAKISAQSKQKFRIILSTKADLQKEASYRVYFNQISNNKKNKNGFIFNLKISIPLFIYADNFKFDEQLQWKAIIQKDKKQIELTLSNNSNKHIVLENLTTTNISPMSFKELRYILPGSFYSWEIPLKNDATPKNLTIDYSSSNQKNSISIPIIKSEIK
ncbi:MAG: molecular chaperone [Myxococcales bacterium]|nr:MAG: molecular chaperone [Myxococcales bacterium]